MSAVRVLHNADNSTAFLQYNKQGEALDFYHTEVPKELRGKGLAGEIVKHAVNYALENKLKVIPTCSYVDKYAKEIATPDEKSVFVFP